MARASSQGLARTFRHSMPKWAVVLGYNRGQHCTGTLGVWCMLRGFHPSGVGPYSPTSFRPGFGGPFGCLEVFFWLGSCRLRRDLW